MGRHALLAVIVFLIVCIGFFGLNLYNYANSSPIATPNQNEQPEAKQDGSFDQNPQEKWIESLAKASKREYYLPVNEIYIEYKRPLNLKTQTAYQLTLDKNDAYSMFCVTQSLRNLNIDFTIIKDQTNSLVFLNSSDSAVLQNVINELKNYEIKTSVMEVKI